MDYRIFFIFCCVFIFPVTVQGSVNIGKGLKFTLSHCAVCHGKDGNASANETWPKLAGQNITYFVKAMKDFRPHIKHGRTNSIMNAIVITLSEKEIAELANYYANLPGSIDAAQAQLVPLGQRLYRGGNLTKGIPACLACHGPAGLGNPPAGFPRLSGQHMTYISEQLKAFRSRKRVDVQHYMMSTIAQKMSDKDIEAVASYISGLYF